MSRLVVDLSPAEHQALKMRATMSGKTLSAYAKAYLFKIPNSQTLDALADVENNNDLQEFSSVDDLFAI